MEANCSSNICCVPECCSRLKPLFRFPNPKKFLCRFRQWIKVVKNQRYESLAPDQVYRRGFVCHKHFRVEDFVVGVASEPRKLLSTAVPALNLPPEIVDNVSPEAQPSTSGVIDMTETIDNDITIELEFKTPEKEAPFYDELYKATPRKRLTPVKFSSRRIVERDYDIASCSAVPDTSLPQPSTSEGYDLLQNFNLVDSRVLEVFDDLPDWNNVLSVDANCSDETQHLETQSDPVEMSLSQADPKTITEKSQNQEVEKPYFRSVKSFLQDSNRMTEVCRICFQSLEEEEVIKLYEQSSQEDVVQIKKMLQLILPDLDLEVYPNTVICVKCAELLVYSYQLKEKWLATEEKLHKIIKKNKGLLNRDADLVIIGKKVVTNVSDIDHDYAGNSPHETPSERKVTNAIIKNLAENLESECLKKVSIFHGNLNSTNLASFKPMKRVVKPKKQTIPHLESYMCEHCAQTFTSRKSFIRHSKVHMDSPKKKSKKRTIMCEICGNLFATTYSLRLHKQKHADLKCDFCDRVFNSRKQRHVHINSKHLQKSSYQCHLCGKQYSLRTSLDVHLKVHNPANRTKACNICDKKFFQTSKLRKHLQSHIKEKLLKCDYCGKFLKHKLSLEQHIKIYHLNEGKFVCEFCNKPYWKRRDLDKHRLRLHQNQTIEESNEVFNEENCAVNSIQQFITFNV